MENNYYLPFYLQESMNEEEFAEKVPSNCDTAKPLQTNLTSQNSFSFSTNESAGTTSVANQSVAGLTANQVPPLPTNHVSSPPVIIDPSPSLNVISKPPVEPVKINFSGKIRYFRYNSLQCTVYCCGAWKYMTSCLNKKLKIFV